MIVYLDLLFLTSLFFDASVLLATAKVRGLRLPAGRLAAGALAGAAYVLPMFHPSFGFLYTALAKVLVSLLVAWLAFGFGSLQRFIGTLGAFYLVQFAAAGGVFAIHFLLLSAGDVFANMLLRPTGAAAFAVETGLWLSVPVFLLSLWFCRSVLASQSRVQLTRALTADVAVEIGGTTVTCRGLIDTGNRLYDPVTRAPVIVMEAAVWEDVLPGRWLALIRSGAAEVIVAEAAEAAWSLGRAGGEAVRAGGEAACADDGCGNGRFGARGGGKAGSSASPAWPWPERLRLVPGRAAGGRPQLLLAFKPDRITVRTGESVHESGKALVALDGGMMDPAGGFQAIIHPMLVTHQSM